MKNPNLSACNHLYTHTHTHTHSSLGISMSGTAVEMTAVNLGELLGLFARRRTLPAAVEMRKS